MGWEGREAGRYELGVSVVHSTQWPTLHSVTSRFTHPRVTLVLFSCKMWVPSFVVHGLNVVVLGFHSLPECWFCGATGRGVSQIRASTRARARSVLEHLDSREFMSKIISFKSLCRPTKGKCVHKNVITAFFTELKTKFGLHSLGIPTRLTCRGYEIIRNLAENMAEAEEGLLPVRWCASCLQKADLSAAVTCTSTILAP